MKLKLLIPLVFLCYISIPLGAQRRIIPPSPEAAALGRYGDIQVNFSTGMMNQVIPIYTIQTNNLTLPISLQYAGGGIKVNEQASWVGLGWVLNAGGVITRTIRGFPDEYPSGFQSTGNRIIPTGTLNEGNVDDFDYLYSITERLIDTEPDIFYFNFASYTGKFIIDRDGTPVLLDHVKIRIVKPNEKRFELTTPDGIKYVFNNTETTIVPGQEGGGSFISSWYLTEIISTAGVEKISFFYTSDASQSTVYPTQSDGIAPGTGLCANSSDLADYGHVASYGIDSARILSRIEFKGGKIIFSAFKDRQDILWGYKLASIQVIRSYDASNTVTEQNYIKGWNFSYSYLNNNVSTIGIKRLLLTALSQTDFSGSQIIQQTFEYFDAPTQGSYSLPAPGSKQQDQWGYYNGAIGNENLLLMIPTVTYAGITKPGANRESGTVFFMQAGSLKKINYPTGGSTVFEYETNDIGGGFRLVSHPKFYSASTNITNNVFTQSVTFMPLQNVTATFTFSRFSVEFGHQYDLRCTPFFEVKDQTTNTIVYYPNTSTSIIPVFSGAQTDIVVNAITLIAGHTYRITASETDSRCGQNQSPEVIAQLDSRISVSYTELGPETEPAEKQKVGGLRILSISNYAIGAQRATKRIFTYESSANTSSGNLLFQPLNGYLGQMWRLSNYTPLPGSGDVCVGGCIPQPGPPRSDQLCSVYFTNSSDMSGLGIQDGYHIQYQKVTEKDVGVSNVSGNARTEYEYSFVQDLGHAGEFPFPPPNSLEAYRGRLIKQTFFNANGQKIQEKQLEYQHSLMRSIIGLKVGRTMQGHPCYIGERPGTACRNAGLQKFSYTNYYYYAFWNYLKKERTIDYDPAQNSTVKEITYEYSNLDHLQLTKQTTNSSKGQILSTEMKYPGDYASGTSTAVLESMKGNAFMHNSVIQSVSKISEGGSDKVIGATIHVPGFFPNSLGGNNILLSELAKLKVTSPIAVASFPNYSPATGYSLNDYNKEMVFSQYDAQGNPIETTGSDGIVTAIIWGYNSTLPVAEVKGLSYNQAVSLSGLNMNVINNVASSDAAIRSEIAKLRTLPGLVLVKGFTYLPLIGMTSETDAKGRVTYYEYDNFRRLSLIRDHDNNVIKKINYNYAGQ